MEIVDLSLHCDESVTDLAKLYFQLASTLRASELLERAKEIRSGDPWESSSARILAKEVLHCIGRVTMATLSQSKGTNPSRITQFIEHRPEAFERYQTTLSEFLSKPPTLSGMLVLTNQLYALSR